MTSSRTGDEWLSLREAADLLGMHPATVRLWADRNELPSRRTNGGHRRFRRADIEARLREEELHAEAVQLGNAYGSITRESRVPVADAVRAFLYFHSLIGESVLQLAEVQGVRDHQDIPWAESLYQIQALTNEILPALLPVV